ncbi:odorant receptor Or2-like isoform X2 [Leptopilina heterotoma]|nr:odorant receptor Or2-like isoform X2 [Leptopilina heterotoma]XP_043473293.1 odorant receptor Or2-like isoform X2 [Leptopilina heterotoma]XP_043473294.1 odorant receptor Or2-like isoform X2 [Leptopilina heterotoma]XP_043473295.1 odorant receptor Or2-like isoform X2 [Leptopilina heterotoma]
MIYVWGDVVKMVECLQIMFICIDALGFTIVFHVSRKKFRKIFYKIKSNWKIWSSDEEKVIMFKYANDGRLLTNLCTVIMMALVLVVLIPPLVPPFLDIILPQNESRYKDVPFPIYYFAEYYEEHFYWIYACVSLNFLLQMFFLITCLSLLAVTIQHACGLFSIISLHLRKIDTHGSEEENLKAVIFCIKQHNQTIEYCNDVESFFSPCLFFVVIVNCIFLSFSLIQVVFNLSDMKMIIKPVIYMSGALVNLLLHSVAAQRLLDHSSGLGDNVYNVSWDEMSVAVRKPLLLMMMRSNHPCKITAGKIMEISFRFASAALRASFSYFTLLSSTTP